MAGEQTYEALGTQEKTLVNDRILDEIAKDPAAYNSAIAAAKKAGKDAGEAFQGVLDSRRNELAGALIAGDGGFKRYEETRFHTNGVEDIQDFANGKTILRQVRDQLVIASPPFQAQDIAPIIAAKRGSMKHFSSPEQEAMAAAPKGVCIAPLEEGSEVIPPRRGEVITPCR